MTPADAFSKESKVVFRVSWISVSSLVNVKDIQIKAPNKTRNISEEAVSANLKEVLWESSI